MKSTLTTALAALGLLVTAAAHPSIEAQVPSVATCAISTTATMSFGAYSVFNASPTDSTASLSYVCSGIAGPVTISLTGVQPDGTRALKNGADLLSYHVFANAARTDVWGDGTFGAGPVVFPKPVDAAVNTAVMYGRVFAGQDVAVGPYSDSFVLVLNF